jgi:hypothetical protein
VGMMAPEGGVPPELMAALQGGGAAPPGMGMAPPPQDFSGEQAGPPPNSADALADLIQLVQSHPYVQTEQDPEDIAAIQNIIAQLTKLQAKQQKEKDAALGVSPAQKGMRRAYA